MDWIQLFDDNQIDYVTRGPNTKRGEASVQCPWCGDDDPSHHLGISLTTENWGCHRSAEHRGKNPVRLVSALLGCTYNRAKLVVLQYSKADPDSLTDIIEAFEPTQLAPTPQTQPVKLPTELRAIVNRGLTAKFWRYLAQRGFDDVESLIQQYQLSCALTGRYKDRVIVPFYDHKKLIGWTGRAIINPKEAPRYLSSGAAVKETIFNVEQVRRGGDVLIVVEGPFDALKLDFYGRSLGVLSTCVFGTSLTLSQICLINEAARKFNHTYILFDPEAIDASFSAGDWLIGPRITVTQLPSGVEDPGAASKEQVHQFVRSLK